MAGGEVLSKSDAALEVAVSIQEAIAAATTVRLAARK
jgi:hypothetical protein